MTNTYHAELADEQATIELGAKIAASCTMHTVIFLHGALGAGKTTFSRGFIHSLGHTGKVKSPTYTLVEPYQLANWHVYHFDLYRLSSPEELEYMGARDYFSADSLCLVEWPEKGEGFLPTPDLAIRLSYLEEKRNVELIAHSAIGQQIISNMECK